jgi:hypothetical protein
LDPNQIFIPPGEVYSEFEKMHLPFDKPTWIGIAVMLVAGVVIISLIKCLSLKNQELILGKNNKSPLMNFISIILNGDNTDNLIENVPRMLMMMFIIWCLIFR